MKFCKYKFNASVSCLALLFSNHAFSTEYTVTTDVDNASGSLRDIIENVVSDGDSVYLGGIKNTTVSSPIAVKDKNITLSGDAVEGKKVETSINIINSLGQNSVAQQNWTVFDQNGDFNNQINDQINSSIFGDMTHILATGEGAFVSNDALGNSFNLNNIALTSSNVTLSGSSAWFVNAGVTNRDNRSISINTGNISDSYLADNTVIFTDNIIGGGIIGSSTNLANSSDYVKGAKSEIGTLDNVIFNNNNITAQSSMFGGGIVGAFSGSFVSNSSNSGSCTGSICFGGSIGGSGGEYSFSEIKGINNSIFNNNTVSFSKSNSTVYLWGGGLIGAANNNGLGSGLNSSSITIGNIENSIFSNNSIDSIEGRLKLHGGGLIGATSWDLETPITLGNLDNNIFSSNSVTAYEVYGGGLVGLNGQSSDVGPRSTISDMDNNLFVNNKITSQYIRGGGLIGVSSSNASIGNTSNSYFYNNTIEARGYGGSEGTIHGGGLIGLVSYSSAYGPAIFGDISNSLFIKNSVSLTNGVNKQINNFGLIGAFNQDNADNRPVYFGNITNSLFQENSVTSTLGSIRGGLIYSSGLGETMNIQNSQFVNNTLSAPDGVSGTIVIDLNAKALTGSTDSTTAHIKLTANDNEQTAFYKNGDSAKNSYNSIYFAQMQTSGFAGTAGNTPQQDAAITVDSNGTGLVNLLDPIKVEFGTNTTSKNFTFSKQGNGLLFLGGENNITGFTTNGEAKWSIDSGEMRLVKTDTSGEASINMEKDGNTQFTVATQGTVSGSGSITASDILINGTLAPSLYQTTDGVTTLSSQYGRLDFLNNVTLDNATYNVDVAKTESDYIYVDGDINSTDSYINVTSAVYDNASATAGNYDGYEKTIMEASGSISGDYKVTISNQALNPIDYLQGIGGRIENNKYILNVGLLSWKSTAFDKESDKLLAHGNFTLKNLDDTFVLTEGLANRTDISVSDETFSGWDGTTLNKKGNGTLILNGINSYTGLTTVEAGTLITGDEQSSSAEIAGNATVASNAILSGTGTILGQVDNQGYIASYNALSGQETAATSNFTVGELNNSGVIQLAGGTAGNTLTVDGNYSGNNGSLLINTILGDSDSVTDKLTIMGATSGNTSVVVTNRGGLGALTTGNGIEVVEVNGSSASDAFALSSDYQFKGQNAVVGGAYAYSLYHNGVDGDVSDGNWYLRSLKITTNPNNPTNPTNPVYQPGAPLYETYPQALLQINQLGTLDQRVGNRTWLNPIENEVDTIRVAESRGFWMKVEGSTGHVNPKRSTTHSDYDIDMIKTQFGVDFNALENDNGTLIGGVYFQYGHANTDVSSRFGKGDIKTNGYGLGGTLTWYGNNDIYVDGVAQAMWYKSDIKSDTLDKNEINGNKGTGYALSIETGKKYALNPEITLTPQAQLSYNNVDFDSFRDAYQAKVSRQDGDALTGRLGIALDREIAWKSESGDMRRLKTYGIANLYYEFLNGTEVSVTGVKFDNRPDPVWGGLGAGLTHSWNDDKYSVYGELTTRSSFADFGNSYSLNGTVGFKARF